VSTARWSSSLQVNSVIKQPSSRHGTTLAEGRETVFHIREVGWVCRDSRGDVPNLHSDPLFTTKTTRATRSGCRFRPRMSDRHGPL